MAKISTLSRREFLLGAAGAGAALALSRWLKPAQVQRSASTPAAVPSNRVVHIHSEDATYWDYATGWYGDYVSQPVVDLMTDRGVMALTNTLNPADAWHALIPNYIPGEKVAIKINLNNATCADDDNVIDALPQPVNSVIRGLKSIGIPEDDIWVYDMTNGMHRSEMPARLVSKVTKLYPNVQFHSTTAGCSTTPGYSLTEKIHFDVPTGKPPIDDRPICNSVVNASYLINMPIMKKHGSAGVTLGFKNHMGSFDHNHLTHWSVLLGDPNYASTYNALVDVRNNPHFKNKTVLTVGDGLFGARINHYSEIPSPWPSFGNKSPNSLFFSVDPVAIDCVMYDILEEEGGLPSGSDDYLKLASASGLGTFEHRDAAHQYHTIDYRSMEASLTQSVYLPIVTKDFASEW